jgi:omega-amidase
MQVVAVQLDMVWQDKPASQAKVRALLADQTIEENALIVLPEMFDTGFSMQLDATAQTAARESERFLRDLAMHYRAAVMAGVVSPLSAGKSTNEAVAFAPDGTELVRYQKMQPFTPVGEDLKYGAGKGHCTFVWNGFKIAPFVCYDLRFPEIFRPAALDGAELLVVMACWPAVRSEHWVRLLQARAIENQAFAVGVNRCGSDPSTSYDGRSTAFNPLGVSLFEADDQEQVCFVNLCPEEVRQWRTQFPALQDIRQEFRS